MNAPLMGPCAARRSSGAMASSRAWRFCFEFSLALRRRAGIAGGSNHGNHGPLSRQARRADATLLGPGRATSVRPRMAILGCDGSYTLDPERQHCRWLKRYAPNRSFNGAHTSELHTA